MCNRSSVSDFCGSPLTVLFELGFGHFVFGRSWESLGSDFDVLHGGLLPLGLLILTLSPLIATRLRGVKTATEFL